MARRDGSSTTSTRKAWRRRWSACWRIARARGPWAWRAGAGSRRTSAPSARWPSFPMSTGRSCDDAPASRPVRILQLVSCRGWSSDAYLAARVSAELPRRGHEVWLGCRRDARTRVVDRARAEGVEHIEAFEFRGGAAPGADAADVRRLLEWLPRVDIVHAHRGKEHWLAAVANRLSRSPRPLVRTRHIVQAVRPHAANRWLYRRATALVHTVSEVIRRQYIAAGLMPGDGVVALPGGVDTRRAPAVPEPALRARLGATGRTLLVGLVAGLRVMKGHDLVIESVAGLDARGGDVR